MRPPKKLYYDMTTKQALIPKKGARYSDCAAYVPAGSELAKLERWVKRKMKKRTWAWNHSSCYLSAGDILEKINKLKEAAR